MKRSMETFYVIVGPILFGAFLAELIRWVIHR